MFDVRPDNDLPGLRVNPFDIQSGDDVPGLRVKATQDVPGFRVPGDGSPSQGHVNVNSPYPYPYPLGMSAYPDATIMDKIRDPDWVVPRLGATFDGAISVVPGLWNAGRAIWRAAGGFGKQEAQQEEVRTNLTDHWPPATGNWIQQWHIKKV